MESNPGQCPFTLDDMLFPAAHGEKRFLDCVWVRLLPMRPKDHMQERSVTLDGGEIDEVADRIYARIARAVQRGERRREGCTFGEFRKQNPLTFDGELDPMAVENWLLKMKKLLRALKCTDAEKVEYATFALQGSAERWWSSTEKLLRMELGRDTPITWEKFKEVLNGTYFPDVVRDCKAREFSDLVQGAMTVEEYAAKFVELSRFVA
ncbi:hypothetical protein SO802_008888 [Lithocarpus litseifolius]|uniref:Retrotransposon gag domain-containing protein n=1 Tax=Lithocarpus litseifolius TaxID=425828 RepID=A0AAW2DFH0_9ROSI